MTPSHRCFYCYPGIILLLFLRIIIIVIIIHRVPLLSFEETLYRLRAGSTQASAHPGVADNHSALPNSALGVVQGQRKPLFDLRPVRMKQIVRQFRQQFDTTQSIDPRCSRQRFHGRWCRGQWGVGTVCCYQLWTRTHTSCRTLWCLRCHVKESTSCFR